MTLADEARSLVGRNWPRVALGEVAKVVSGATPKTGTPEYWGGKIPWATPKDLSDMDGSVLVDTAKKLTPSGYASCSTQMMPSGSVLFSSRAPIGLVALAGVDICTNQGFKSLVPGERLDGGFLYHVMRENSAPIAALGRGATFKEVSKEIVASFEIPLPPLEEQKRIAAILDKADAIRRKREQTIIYADQLLRSIFLELFGPIIGNDNSPSISLGEIADIASGVTKGRKLNGQEVRETPYLRVANVQDGYLDLNEIKTIPATAKERVQYALEHGDILLTEGGDPDKLGRGYIWHDEIPGCIHQNHVFRVRLHDARVTPKYVSFLIGSDFGKRYFLKNAKQTTGIATINKTQLREFPVALPSFKATTNFEALVSRFWEGRSNFEWDAVQSSNLFSSLSQELLP